MSSLEKRHTGQRGSMQGHRKYSDGLSDTSSSGSFLDDTDREVSNLTDRAFRSLCIGEEAIYNDSEFSSSPTERHKAFAEETQQKTISHEALSYSIQQYGEAEVQSEMASTFQHSCVDVTHQEQAFREGSLSYMNNGSKEVTWQQSRSTSRVSSLIKAFSSGECYHDSGTCDVILARDRYRDFGSESWDKSAMLSIQRELSEFSSGHHQNFKSGPFQSYRNHFYTSDVAATVAQMDTTVLMKSSKSKFKALNSTNSFFHSEFSLFQLWEEYNRFSFQSTNVSGFMSASEFPWWYDSPMYKELKENHRIPNSSCESRRFDQRQIQDVVASQRSRSTVVQKASAIEKRCESEMASNYPPWKKNNNLVRNKLPGNRPSTVSPTNERTCRPDSNLFRNNKVTHEIVIESNQPSSVTPFNITQLLTPVIHTRQETETSEILQFAHTPSVSDYSSQGETDSKLQTDVKHLRDSYKSKASSLLFNLKDNRKRVKSTYSPTRFKGLEITDQNKQTSKLEGRESRFSDIFVSQETAQENLIGMDARASCNLIREPSAAPITPKDYTDGFGSYDNLTLNSPQIQDRVANYKLFRGSSEGHSPSTGPLANTELSTHYLSAQDKSSLTSEGQLKDLNGAFIPPRPEIANVLPKAYPPTHSLPAQTSELYGQSDNASQNDLKQRKDFGRKTFIEYSQKNAVKEKCLWDQIGSVKETDSRSESQPFRREIAALIEMDKQRKATAKQYFANDSYSVRKEMYMQKVNEDIKLGRLAKEEEKEVREDTISPRKTTYCEKSIHDNQLSTFSKPTESYGIPKNSLQTKTSPLTEVYGGLQSFSVKNDFVKGVPAQNSFNSMVTQNTFDQRAHDDKGQENEGLYSYQPYRYEPNKQWHMSSTSEDRHTKESVWTQKQSEMIEQTGAKCYKISNTSSSALHIHQNEFSTNNGAPNPALQDKDSVIPNIDTSHQNNTSLPTKQENRFSINDILAIRDNEQARRLRDNTFVLAKTENPQNPIKYDTAEKLTITEPVNEQQGYKLQDITSPSPGYVRKDFQNTNETNISTDRKDSTMCKDTDKVTTRVLSYKERSQSKQEILTSKLKAHAQKEISAIKEKGLAKQGILVRNTTKTRGTINNDGQEGHSAKKEITADKLNHLFQDITYSSVTQYKEQIKLHNDHPKNRSPPSTEIQPLHFEDNQNAVPEKKNENVKYKPLAIERQNDKHPADDNEMKETSTQDRRATATNMKNYVHKNYQPSRISEDKQISMTSSENINTNKESAKQSHEMSPGESMSGHLTATVKTYRENYTSHNPPAQHKEKQTVQHDQKENLYGSSQSQYTSSEKAVTKPADIIKEDLHVTSTEITKSNSGLNKNSLLGLEKNTPRVEEAYVRLKSKITAAVEQSKNEPIKNSSGIAASQLTSSSSDIKFKNGIPPAKRLMEPAKSELTSNLQNNTLNVDPEQLINRTYKHNSGVNSDSEVSSTENTVRINSGSTNGLASQRTREPETLNPFNNEDVQALINKNNITQENDLAKQQNNTSQVKAVETTSVNQMVESHSKPEADEESLTQIASAEESCQQKEIHQDDENTKTLFSFDKNELPRNHQSISRIKDDSEVVNNGQQREKITESASPKQEQGFPRPLEISHEKNNPQKSTKEFQEVNTKPQRSAEDALKPNASPQHKVIVEEDATQKNNIQPVLTQNVESTADTSNITILSPSNEEPAEEPIIYSICVSSKTEAVSNDEPMIYNICVSSKCHIDEQQNPVKQEEESSVETDRFVKDESFCIKNKRAENEHYDVHRQTEVSSNIKEKEDKIGKCEPSATTDKSGITGRISTSYEDLLAKYGLPVRVCGHLTSKHMQDQREQKEKEETETHLPHKPVNHGMNRPLPSKDKSSDTTQTHPEDSRQVSDQQASITNQPLKGTESEIKQVIVQHYDTISITHSNNMAEKQQSTGNNMPKLGHSTRDATIILKDTENFEQDQDTHIEPSRQSRRNDIELKEKKVEEQVRNTDKVQSLKMTGNIDVVSNSRESSKKTENVSLTAKQPTTTDESTRPTKTEVLKAPISSMAKDTVNTKLIESTIPERMISQSKKKSQKVEGEDKLFNDTDTFTSHKNKIHGTETFNLKVEKTVHEAKQKDPVMAMKQESVSDKHAQTLQKNVKEDEKGGEKRSQEKLQVDFNTSNEIINRMKMVLKNGTATHVNNYRYKVSSIGEDLCTVVKQDQACFEVPKIHLKDIKVSTAEVSSNKEFMAGHKNQHEVIKKENLKGKKGAVVTELVGEKDFTEQNNLPVKPLKVQNEPKTVDNMKGHIEMTCKNTYDVGKEITPLMNDSPSKLEKTEINSRQGAVETQDIKVYDNKQPTLNSDKRKKEDPVLSLSGQNEGDLKVNENRSRGKKERNVEATETKQGDQTNTNQYQQETKGSARYEQDNAQLTQQDTRKEGILSKPEATQRNKKVTRPEISAIADYARLKVISAEDDTKELDIFPKTDIYNSYDQPVLRIHKDLYGNVSDIGGEFKRDVISMEKCQNLKQKTSQLQKQTDKEMLPQKQNHLIPSTVQLKPVSLVASGSQDEAASMGTQPRALTNQKESNTKPTFMEYPNRREGNKMYQSKNTQGVPLQADGTINRSRQMTRDKTTEKGNRSHYGRQESLANLSSSGTVKATDNQINMTSPPGEEMEELQYYTVNALDTEIKPKEAPEPPPPRLKMSQNTDSAEKSEKEKKEDSFLLSLIDYGKVHVTVPRSNSSSPAMGKPVMFRVKDNTIRTSSVTKTVKPCFHRSFSEDFRIGSPKEHLSGSEKEVEIHPKESANPPVNHEPAIAALQLHKLKETLHNNLPSAEYATKQSKSHQRRSQHFEEEETRSVISTMSEDMENCTASLTDVANISVAFMPKHESYRDTYQRPVSACYERPESSCYERPESARSDMRPLGKPPAVPPKSEKALRRAQRLTTRHMKKQRPLRWHLKTKNS